MATATMGDASAQLTWSSGFENGYPGEWLPLPAVNSDFSVNGTMPAGKSAAWTITQGENGVLPFAGRHMYKGWITAPQPNSHNAFPVIHAEEPTPLINTFMVWLDADYSRWVSGDWIHFGTWGNEGEWALQTMSVQDRKLVFAHTDPFLGEYIGPQPQPDFPLRRWVRFTMYLHYTGSEGFSQVWQDGVPMLRANVVSLQRSPGRNLQRAHWGMYAHGRIASAVQYNDDIRICRLAQPLTNLVTEPICGSSGAPSTAPPRAPTNLVVQ